MDKSDCRFIGVLAKLNGFKGSYVLLSDTYLNDEIENWESIFLEIEGLLVPFFIISINITSDLAAVISLEGISSAEKAKEFLSCKVFQVKSLVLPAKKQKSNLVGYKVIDQKKGIIGLVDQVLDYNKNMLLRILKNENEILIPIADEIIVKIDHKKKEILIASPEGLLDLYN
jgi:16S rRNA processing protein RimM